MPTLSNAEQQKLERLLQDIVKSLSQETERGAVADYIPELACIDPNQFGIAVALADGTLLQAGDSQESFSVQSITKVFTLAMALDRIGAELWQRVGREPSGLNFNSIIPLEIDKGIPRNPFVNAGAIVTTDVVLSGCQRGHMIEELLSFVRRAAEDSTIDIDASVAASEASTGYRNQALASFLRASGNLHHEPQVTLDAYFHQCALAMNCVQLARAGRFLIISPETPNLIPPRRVRRINALMMTCGLYDAAGDFAFRVGLPAKSGVGGGLLLIVPHVASVAIWSPALNAQGNSTLGLKAAEMLATEMGWSVFG
ncbi:MAG: glutaminase [Pseudomonadota bacterium]|nr:glutaminase [Pseudomonadota bacterium]